MASNAAVLFLNFNQDNGCFSCGMENGIRMYNVEPLSELYRQEIPDCGGAGLVSMLNRTNLIALVGHGKHMKYPKNKVFIIDASTKKAVLEFTFGSQVLNVKLRKDMIFIVLRNKIYGYSFPNKVEQQFVLDTRENPKGICALSSAFEQRYLAFPGRKCGSIQLADLNIRQPGSSASPLTINAHQHEIACLAINQQGTQIATASTKGTLIRVFDIKQKRQLLELRRGADQAALYCINFNPDGSYLCASSDKGTVHIFALRETGLNKRSTLAKVGLFGQYIESQWGVANFSVPAECPCICAFGPGNSVVAVCIDGSFHKYVFTKDGNCNRESFDIFLDLGDDDYL